MNKNKFLAIFFSIVGMASVYSCSDYLEVENLSNTAEKQQFDSASDTFAALVGVYNSAMGDNTYGQRMNLILSQSGDDFRTSGDYNANDRRGISCFGAVPTNTELLRPFLDTYAGIERANLVIKNIPISPVYQTGSAADKKLMDRYLGEALTLRALFYYDLIKNWGDIPFQEVPSADLATVYLPKTDRDVIYDKILDDLAKAATLVPWKSEAGTTAQRISKAAVKGLRARIALARAGYSLRRSPQAMVQGSNPQKYYQIAYDECKDIINSGEHKLNPSYEGLFRSLHTNSQDATNEVIFAVGAFGGNSRTDSKIGYYNGLRHDDTDWKSAGGISAIPTYFYEFSKFDLRRDVNIAIFRVSTTKQEDLQTSINWNDAKFRKSWTNITGTSQNLGIDWPLLRYADVLLMFAEADNELHNGASPEAVSAVLSVKQRAFAGNSGQVGTIPTGKNDFFNFIVKERLLEFGGEGLRKYDLIRWNLLETKINETRQKLVAFMNGTGAYANVPEYIFYKKPASTVVNYVPTKTAQQNVLDMDLYVNGIAKADVFYSPNQSVATPTGYTKVNWRLAMTQPYISGDPIKSYAHYFEPNKKELLPIALDVINSNYNLTQDYGY
ncbi:RagB/SusD family nutrient uptake outer membrane protein [Chryseobacterium carnipullorum]|uniref:RagB/SusD family nutrient uptake outer membrane protein n=1 Tax=Chryseobacterium carnipullorum TaxID=1124835 RepID=A0A3G6M357_CHRCU|nr:RagB/SusD family nutrient uptake outer membrane protein [Chryseobacterium carnipullorum]AZA49267.1 RagB/SusD family nutrient uptake outer membrane protein [Chryseobacterium carnipullorum]AZA67679.1 RagB/SusD family nutrient uptake outer membrane protein [Chryseobacterium carnipullorum]